MSQRSEFARFVRELRRAKGWSLRELGTRAKVDFTSVSKIENDEYVPSLDTIQKLAFALEATPSQVRRLIDASDKRRDQPVEFAPAPSRDAQILLKRIYSGAVTREQFKRMLDVVEENGGSPRQRQSSNREQNGQERLLRR